MNPLVLLVVMTVNGVPHGEPMRITAMSDACRAELSVVEGINRANQWRGVEWRASCLTDITARS